MDYNNLLYNVNSWKIISLLLCDRSVKCVVPSDFCFLGENFKNYYFLSGIVLFYF